MGNITTEPADKIAANLARYQELTAELKELAEVPRQHDAKVDELYQETADLATARRQLAKLDLQQKHAYEDWQAMNNSTATRMWTKIKGKGKAAVQDAESSREHAYEAAFNEGQDKLQFVAELEAVVAHTSEQEAALREKHQRHDDLRACLLSLYDDVFAGPTPQYPEEDAAENAYTAACDTVTLLRTRLAKERATLSDYGPLIECAERAERQFGKAQQYMPGDSNGRRLHHQGKAMDNYHRARQLQNALIARRPDIEAFQGLIPERTLFNAQLTKKRAFCMSFVEHLHRGRQAVAADVASVADQLVDAKADRDRRCEKLEEVRCLIMDGRVEEDGAGPAPPAYDDPPPALV